MGAKVIDYRVIKWIGLLSSIEFWLVFAFGLCLGSFLNVCIYRVPKGIFFSKLRSFCPSCDALIPAYWNIPLVSFFLLKGKSHCCGKPISWRYPVVEILTALLLALVFSEHPFLRIKYMGVSFYPEEALRFIHAAIFSSLLIVISFIDFELKIIPNVISFPMMGVGPLCAFMHPDLLVKDSLWGLFLGTGIVYLVAWIYYMIRKAEGIGMGDAKLLGAIGGWLGYQAVFPTFFYASVLGSIFGLLFMLGSTSVNMRSEIPFGPYLALGSLIYLLVDREFMLRWFLI